MADGQTVLEVRMELLSDAIFGSGFSVPGGEDVAVNQDRQGWPYMKGSTFKGLLRESLENLLVWTGGGSADLDALMGMPGWDNPGGPRRIHLTELTLFDRPASPEDCYSLRTFTSLEGGVVKTGTLRTAACIRKRLIFTGLLYCQPEDADLLKDALLGVKWVGTMRSRGFGRVRVTGTEIKPGGVFGGGSRTGRGFPVPPPGGAACIRYRLRTDSPVLATDMARSWGNSWETLHCIPGAAVRGALIRRWTEEHPEEAGREASGFLRQLLSDGVRFSDAFPTVRRDAGTRECETESPSVSTDKGAYFVPLPSPLGFYEDKREEHFHSILKTGEADSGCKPAKLGHFCALENRRILFWNASTDSTLRIQRGNGNERGPADGPPETDGRQIFETRYLDAGQFFTGSVLLDDPALAADIAGLFSETLWLGADRFGGFGKCTVTKLDFAEDTEILETYGMKQETDRTLYLLLLSPTSMRNRSGECCGLDEAALAEKLGVESLCVQYSAAPVSDYSGYNSTWECRVPGVRMYDRGSVFRLECGSAPKLDRIRAIERSGLGLRRAEGYGQVLFLSPRVYEGLRGKQKISPPAGTAEARTAAAARRARLLWVMERTETVQGGKLSTSQVGTIQSLCEKAAARDGDWQELRDHLAKNVEERGARHGDRFTAIQKLIETTMRGANLTEEMNVKTDVEKLKLLCLLFDYSRKAASRRKEGTE